MTLEDEGLKTVSDAGTAAKSRFTDPQALRNVYDALTQDDAMQAARRAKIQRVYDGHLPSSPAQLAASGLKFVANINWLGLKGAIDNRADVLLKLGSDTTNLVELRPLAREMAGPELVRAARIIADEFSTMLRETGDVIPALARMNSQADLFGLGPVTWLNDIDYRPVALDRSAVRFVPSGPVQSNRHELVMFEASMSAAEAFMLLDNSEESAAEGWNIQELKKWVVGAFRDRLETGAQPGVEDGTTYVEYALSMIRQNRFAEECQFRPLKVIHAYVREVSSPRRVTHIICPAAAASENSNDFLYRKMNAYRSMKECFVWFPYAVNYKCAGEVRGLASYILAIELFQNRLKNRAADMAWQYMAIMCTQGSVGSGQSLTLNEQGIWTIVPKELTLVQNNVKPDMNQVVSISQYFDRIGVSTVTGSDKGPIATTGPKTSFVSGQPAQAMTKAEVELQQALTSNKEKGLFVQRMQVLDTIFSESFRRTGLIVQHIMEGDPWYTDEYPEVVDYISRVTMRGVSPETVLQAYQTCAVVTCRDLVLGSDGKVGVLSELLGSFGGNLDEPGRKNAQHDWVELKLGTQSADRYSPEVSRDNAPLDQASFATLENNQMKMGMDVLMGQDQWHWSHIPVHSQVLQEIVQQVAAPEDNAPDADSFNGEAGSDLTIGKQTLQNLGGQDPKQLQALLARCSRHVQEHLSVGSMQSGMEQQAKQVQKMLRDLRPTIKALNLAVATQERVEQAEREKQEREMQDLQNRADQNELEKAKYEIDRRAEIDRYRVDKEHEVALRKAGLDEQMSAAKTAREDRAAEAAEMRRDAESESKIAADRKISDARANAARAVGHMDVVNDVIGAGRVSPADIAGNEQEPAGAALYAL